jgi:hypothetical protein
MIVYVGRNFTSRVTQFRLVPVICEKCQTEYSYLLARFGVGTGTAPYMIGQDAARQRAQNAAMKQALQRVQNEAELVPCPKCNWVSQPLIAAVRKRAHRGWTVAAIAAAVLGAFSELIVYGIMSDTYVGRTDELILWTIALVGIVGIPVALYCIGRHRRLQLDPNLHVNRALPIGTPPALLPGVDPATGEQVYVPAGEHQPLAATLAPGLPLPLRPGQLYVPPVCMACLAPATTTYKPVITVSQDDPVAPACDRCARSLRWRFWRLLLSTFGLVFVGVGGPVYLIPMPGMEVAERLALAAICGGLVAGLAAFIVAVQRSRPFRLKPLDSDRGVMGLHCANPQYLELMRQELHAAETIRLKLNAQ